MMIIRAFEAMLDSVKKQGKYKEIPYNHRGPAHRSIGQEAAAVGEAYLLTWMTISSVRTGVMGRYWPRVSAIESSGIKGRMSIMSGYFEGERCASSRRGRRDYERSGD